VWFGLHFVPPYVPEKSPDPDLAFQNSGGVPEWLNGAVSKTVGVARRSWVRIPPPPQNETDCLLFEPCLSAIHVVQARCMLVSTMAVLSR
jgi:hypothetical protein